MKPLSRQVTSLKMNNQNVKVLYETLGKLTGINVIWDPEYQQPSKNYNVDLTNTNLEEALDHLSVMTKTYWKALSANTIFLTNDNITKRRDYEDNVVKVFYLQNITSVRIERNCDVGAVRYRDPAAVYVQRAERGDCARDGGPGGAGGETAGRFGQAEAGSPGRCDCDGDGGGTDAGSGGDDVTGDSPGLKFNVSPATTSSGTTTDGGLAVVGGAEIAGLQ